MRYAVDHDYHIHSGLSLCSGDPEQTPERMLRYAEDEGLKTICITDHFWDESIACIDGWYKKQDFGYISRSLPLPTSDKVEFLFGAETELNVNMTLGISKEKLDKLSFLIIPTTHLHTANTISPEDGATPEGRARVWVSRLDGVLDMDLPFGKIGIAHLACSLIAKEHSVYLKTLELLPEKELERVFAKAAKRGVGIELNKFDMNYSESEKEIILRPFRIAKNQGCKFYLGGDAHFPKDFATYKAIMERAVTDLNLTENDKFYITR